VSWETIPPVCLFQWRLHNTVHCEGQRCIPLGPSGASWVTRACRIERNLSFTFRECFTVLSNSTLLYRANTPNLTRRTHSSPSAAHLDVTLALSSMTEHAPPPLQNLLQNCALMVLCVHLAAEIWGATSVKRSLATQGVRLQHAFDLCDAPPSPSHSGIFSFPSLSTGQPTRLL
jgi:hypothetical protein